ncbi:MAG: hypothetical protein ABI822_24255, partial [Bryobacteraceae bacterium]
MFSRPIALIISLMWAWNVFAQQSRYESAYLRVDVAGDRSGFAVLAVDSLGKGKLDVNTILPPETPDLTNHPPPAANGTDNPGWTFNFSERDITIHSWYSPTAAPLVLSLDPILCHPTLIGLFKDDGNMALPALLHFPDHGTLRITSDRTGRSLGYDALRGTGNFVRVTFPPATPEQPSVEYGLEVVAIYPDSQDLADDNRYDGLRRNFLSIFQLNPRRHVLANHAASDPCAFTVYMYAAMAARMPPLADGLSAMDILRQTLDRYIGGMKAYGMALYDGNEQLAYDFLDTYPSLVMAAADYAVSSHDRPWIDRNYAAVKSWADKMVEFDRDDDGLMEYPVSGNSGSWSADLTVRPSNWWDTIGFGHKDAYANALAYGAFLKMANLARMASQHEDALYYRNRARKLKQAYYHTFYNPATGVLAGWKSADGRLHDYYFLFVNGAAVTYGVITRAQGEKIWDRLM